MREKYLVDRKMYAFHAGHYSGVIMPEHVMKKICKLNAKHAAEVKRVLHDHKDELMASDWTLANEMDGEKILKQITVRYALSDEKYHGEVTHRLSLFKPQGPEFLDEFYVVDSREQAQEIAEEILAEELSNA